MNPMHALRALLLVFLAATIGGVGCSKNTTPQTQDSDSAARDSLTIELSGRDSVNILDLLRHTHSVETKSTAMGTYVLSIDSIDSGNHLYWMYTVNDSSPQIACDRYITRAGDRIVWHLRKM